MMKYGKIILLIIALSMVLVNIAFVSSGLGLPEGSTTDEGVALIESVIEELSEMPEMKIAGWLIDIGEKEVVIWVYGLTPENQQLEDKIIDGWKIIVAQSPIPADQTESQRIAEDYFLLNSHTFNFDGIEESLKLVDTNTLKCPYCWEFVFEFQCLHAGYGNRTGKMLAEVIRLHTARITVEQGRVVSAIMDEKWDIMEQKMIEDFYTYMPTPHAWHLMRESVFLWKDGKKQFVAGDDSLLSNFLLQTIHRSNLQAKCVFSEKRIVKETNKVIEMRFRFPEEITTSQWIEPEERDHIKTDKNGYIILENVTGALFILEDNLDDDLEGHILVKSFEGWSCWAIQEEGSDELDKIWIDRINSIIRRPIISVNSSVFEGERWMVIFSDGEVVCYSDHYYPNYKEIAIREGHISREEIDALLNLFSNLSGDGDYTVNVSEQITGRDYLFEPTGNAKILCTPSNKTLKLELRTPSFPEPETVTPGVKEILERIDVIYKEAEVIERRKENNPSKIPGFEPLFAIAGLLAVAYLLRRRK